jgi:hypothetical protein
LKKQSVDNDLPQLKTPPPRHLALPPGVNGKGSTVSTKPDSSSFKLPGIETVEERDWLLAFIHGNPTRQLAIMVLLEADGDRVKRFIGWMHRDPKGVNDFFLSLEDKSEDEIRGVMLAKLYDSDAYKIPEDLLREGQRAERHAATRDSVESKIRNESKEIISQSTFFDLNDREILPEGPERDEIIEAVFELITANAYTNVDPQTRATSGCIYHVPKNVRELRKRIDESRHFFVLSPNQNSPQWQKGTRCLGFTEITNNRVKRLYDEGEMKHVVKPLMKIVKDFSDADSNSVAHEQLIVADLRLGVKGVGTACLDHAIDVLREAGVDVITTEIQGIPPNNGSQTFHLLYGYRILGTIIEDAPRGIPDQDKVAFVVYALPISEEAQQEFSKYNPTPKPTTDDEESR